jgi:adenine/guanine phosphoribosyltransferase-like PRPP-binding protein
MPANASCIICPQGWHGETKNLIEVLIDVPIVRKTGKLPAGSYYDMKELQAAAKTAAAAAAAVEKADGKVEGAAAAVGAADTP